MGKTIPEPDERIQLYRDALAKAGFSVGTVYDYAKGARLFLLSKKQLNKEGLDEFFSEEEYSNPRSRQVHKTGAKTFLDFINGRELVHHTPQNKRGSNGKRRWHGCNEDCFNCEYPDCYKPEYKILTHGEEN